MCTGYIKTQFQNGFEGLRLQLLAGQVCVSWNQCLQHERRLYAKSTRLTHDRVFKDWISEEEGWSHSVGGFMPKRGQRSILEGFTVALPRNGLD